MRPALAFDWTVPTSHPALAGHFPDNPIVPGVVLLDRLMIIAQHIPTDENTCWDFQAIKFLQAVRGGDHLVFELNPQNGAGLSFNIFSQTQVLVAQGRLMPSPAEPLTLVRK